MHKQSDMGSATRATTDRVTKQIVTIFSKTCNKKCKQLSLYAEKIDYVCKIPKRAGSWVIFPNSQHQFRRNNLKFQCNDVCESNFILRNVTEDFW